MSGSDRTCGLSALVALALAGCIGPHATSNDLRDRRCGAVRDSAAQALEWFAPADGGDRQNLEAWCAGVGPVIVDTLPEQAARASFVGDSLRVLVWNVSAGGGDLVGFLEAEAGVRCRATAAAPPFILLAQEAYRRSFEVPSAERGTLVSAAAAEDERSTPRIDVRQVAEQCGLALIYVPAVRNGGETYEDGREDRGNAILANVPLHDPIAIELPAEDSRRLALAATVRSPAGDSARVVSFHFTLLPKLWRNLTTGNAARVRHALGLLDALTAIEAQRGAAISTIAAGDANTWSTNDAALRRLREAFPDSPPPLAGGTRGPFPADHLFFRSPAGAGGALLPGTWRRLPSHYHSDHFGVAVTLAFVRGPTPGTN